MSQNVGSTTPDKTAPLHEAWVDGVREGREKEGCCCLWQGGLEATSETSGQKKRKWPSPDCLTDKKQSRSLPCVFTPASLSLAQVLVWLCGKKQRQE